MQHLKPISLLVAIIVLLTDVRYIINGLFGFVETPQDLTMTSVDVMDRLDIIDMLEVANTPIASHPFFLLRFTSSSDLLDEARKYGLTGVYPRVTNCREGSINQEADLNARMVYDSHGAMGGTHSISTGGRAERRSANLPYLFSRFGLFGVYSRRGRSSDLGRVQSCRGTRRDMRTIGIS